MRRGTATIRIDGVDPVGGQATAKEHAGKGGGGASRGNPLFTRGTRGTIPFSPKLDPPMWWAGVNALCNTDLDMR